MRQLLAAAFLLLAACSGGPQVTNVGQEDLPPELFAEPQSPSAPARDVRVTVYFVAPQPGDEASEPSGFRLLPLRRAQRTTAPPEELAIRVLLSAIREDGEPEFLTAIPTETELLRISVEKGIAEVNFSAAFEDPEASVVLELRIAQVVWTLTELPDVDAVRFLIHGAHEPVIDQDGVAHGVVSRARYADYAPESVGSLVENCTVVETIEGCEEGGPGG